MQVNLDEFVSDYLAMFEATGERLPPKKKLAEDIVDQYLDQYEGDRESLISQTLYYL